MRCASAFAAASRCASTAALASISTCAEDAAACACACTGITNAGAVSAARTGTDSAAVSAIVWVSLIGSGKKANRFVTSLPITLTARMPAAAVPSTMAMFRRRTIAFSRASSASNRPSRTPGVASPTTILSTTFSSCSRSLASFWLIARDRPAVRSATVPRNA